MSEDREIYGDESVDDEDQLQPGDSLDDADLTDVLDRGFSPPDRPPWSYEHYPTPAEQRQGERLDDRLAMEEPEPDPWVEESNRANDTEDDPNALDEEIGLDEPDGRAGRIVQPDQGNGEDVDGQEVGMDVGIDGAGASAEEAAMHYTRGPEAPF